LWNESYYLDFCAPPPGDAPIGHVGGYVRIGTYPNLGVIWYWACVVGPDRPLVTVIDQTVPLPSAPGSLEIRHDGLWADHNVETPLEHFSLGLEAFGVGLDDPADVYRGAYGDRTPVAFDLEWETDGPVFRYPDILPRYEIPCRVHGEIRVGHETIELDGFGQRDHSWGPRDWWSSGWCWTAFRMDDGARLHGVTPQPTAGWSERDGPIGTSTISPRSTPATAGGQPEGTWAIGYDQEPRPDGGIDQQVVTAFAVETVPGPEGIPVAARFAMNERVFDVVPLGWSPQLLISPDGRAARFPRAMARFTEVGGALDGRTGLGWFELNQPPRP